MRLFFVFHSFLVSLLFHRKNVFMKTRLNYTINNTSEDEELNVNSTELKTENKYSTPTNQTDLEGYDNRVEENKTENAILLEKIRENMYVYDLLKKLTSPFLSQNTKLKYWFEYLDYSENKSNGISKYVPNLTRGLEMMNDEFEW